MGKWILFFIIVLIGLVFAYISLIIHSNFHEKYGNSYKDFNIYTTYDTPSNGCYKMSPYRCLTSSKRGCKYHKFMDLYEKNEKERNKYE